MNNIYIHLVTSHIPLFGVFFGITLLILSILKKSDDFKKLGLITLVISSVFVFPVFFSGDKAEKPVKKIQGVSRDAVENHEDMAKVVVKVIPFLGALSLLALFLKDKKQKNVLVSIIVFGLISEALIIKTASLGGKIRHTEINTIQEIID